MFGYVVIDKPNILIKDYNTYRAYYCGLCKSIGKVSGQLMRFTLNYDIVLLALLGHNYEELDPVFKEGHCIAHPVGPKRTYVEDNPVLQRIADINAILAYYKLLDDVIDEGKHRSLKNALKPVYKKAAARQKAFDQAVKNGYERLRRNEKENSSLTVCAECFGSMLMAAGDALTEKCDVLLREFLFYTGKWIYVIDAYDDIKKDFDKNFNPFLRDVKVLDDKFFNGAEAVARQITYDCIEKITDCYNRMEIKVSEGPLSNIVYRGLAERTEYVIKKRGEKWPKIRL